MRWIVFVTVVSYILATGLIMVCVGYVAYEATVWLGLPLWVSGIVTIYCMFAAAQRLSMKMLDYLSR